MTPDIENFIKTLKIQNSNKIPIAELGVHPIIKEAIIGRPIRTLKDDIDFWFAAGYDYTKIQPGCDFNPDKIGVEKNLTFKEDGTLSYKWASQTNGVITTEQDYENYKFPEASDFDYTRFDDAKGLLPEGMGVVGQYGDIFTMTWEMMGFETFSYALFENPELVLRLNERLGNLVMSMFETFVQYDCVKAIWYSDDIAFQQGLLVSPDVLELLFFPWLRKIGNLAREYNKPLIYHTDGILWNVFDKLIEAGISAIHPIEPKAMELKEVKSQYGSQLSLICNIDVDLLARGSESEITKNVYKNIEEASRNGGYCMGSGNSIPDYVKLENYLAMLKAVRDYNQSL
ncbi:MAG: nucleoside 2-deoxyribosyltransferase [Ignavibacteriales bacterium]|nr:nucleoside 2-deoxyribosyltransferase [Ignavibacteriales bacterium]